MIRIPVSSAFLPVTVPCLVDSQRVTRFAVLAQLAKLALAALGGFYYHGIVHKVIKTRSGGGTTPKTAEAATDPLVNNSHPNHDKKTD